MNNAGDFYIGATIALIATAALVIIAVNKRGLALWLARITGLAVSSPSRFTFWVRFMQICIAVGASVLAILGFVFLHQGATWERRQEEAKAWKKSTRQFNDELHKKASQVLGERMKELTATPSSEESDQEEDAPRDDKDTTGSR